MKRKAALLLILCLGLSLWPLGTRRADEQPFYNVPLIEDLDLFNKMREDKGLPPLTYFDLSPENVLYLTDREVFDAWLESGDPFPYEKVAQYYNVPIVLDKNLSLQSAGTQKLRITIAQPLLMGTLSRFDRGEKAVAGMLIACFKPLAADFAEGFDTAAPGREELSRTDRLLELINEEIFGFKHPLPDAGPGYRQGRIFNPDLQQNDYSRFYERVVRNIQDGYAMPLICDRSILYPGESGDQWVLLNGYLADAEGGIIAFYFMDPNPRNQDPHHGGLKYISPQDLLLAIYNSYEQAYLW